MISEGVLMKVYCLSSAFSSACVSRNWGGELMKIYKGQGAEMLSLPHNFAGLWSVWVPLHDCQSISDTEWGQRKRHLPPAPGGVEAERHGGGVWVAGCRKQYAPQRRIDGCRTKRCKSLSSNWLIKAATPATGVTRWLALPLPALSSPLFTMSTFLSH